MHSIWHGFGRRRAVTKVPEPFHNAKLGGIISIAVEVGILLGGWRFRHEIDVNYRRGQGRIELIGRSGDVAAGQQQKQRQPTEAAQKQQTDTPLFDGHW